MSVYTKTGDSGTTALYRGRRVKKSHPTVELLGSLDELNALLGVVQANLGNSVEKKDLSKIQSDLFVIGSVVAGIPIKPEHKRLIVQRVQMMETAVDRMTSKLPILKSFIIPSGSKPAALLHLARAVCRRCERALVRLNKYKELTPYLNRLSDYLFVLARYENKRLGVFDELVTRIT